jgi:hypothetical protein
MNSLSAFAGATHSSFGKAADSSTVKLISDLIDVRISIRHKISPNSHATDVFDRFLQNGVERRIIQLADEQFEISTGQLEATHFLNVSADSPTLYWLNLIHFLVSNRFAFMDPVLFDLYEN